MKNELRQLFETAVDALVAVGELPSGTRVDVQIDRARQKQHGDFATNLALVLAGAAKTKPRELAEKIVAVLPESGVIQRLEIAGPGFINIFIDPQAVRATVTAILKAGENFGRMQHNGERITVEFVSANPTGPLHVGHGRGAAYGDALTRVLRAAGFDVLSEYYVNDAGRQMDILALSVWLRYLELRGSGIEFPSNAYKGEYIRRIAAQLELEHQGELEARGAELFDGLDESDPDRFLDELIRRARATLGGKRYEIVFDLTRDLLVADIRQDLEEFRVVYDNWFSEKSLITGGGVQHAVDRLRENGHLYEDNGATWFRSTRFGDEKDRVVVRANGAYTYFASDIAYILNKVERGFGKLIYVWGADHHGYITRVRAAFEAMGFDPARVIIQLVQFAVLYRGSEKAQMSTRSGEFVTLRQLREEVGEDAARFFYAMRKPEQHMDFDLELAKSQSRDNPVYYIQYAHARIWNLLHQAETANISVDLEGADPGLLQGETEFDLITALSRFTEVVETAARDFEPHQIAYYLKDVANNFHGYYDNTDVRFLDLEEDARNACFALCRAAATVIANGLNLLGVSAPRRM